MSDVTVRQLAKTVGVPVERLLKQMRDAGLSHESDGDAVSDDERQRLLAHLKRSHGTAESGPKKITLKRKSVGTLKTGQGRAGRTGRTGRTVNIEVRAKKTYVKRADIEPEAVAKPQPEAPRPPSQAELEAQRIRDEETKRKEAQEETRRVAAEKKAEEERRKEEERLAAEAAEQQVAKEAVEETAPEPATPREDVEAKVVEATVEAQVQAQASEKGGKRAKGKERERKGDGGGKARGRRELTLKSERRGRRRTHHKPIHVEQQGGEFKPTEFIARDVEIGEVITVGDLAGRMTVKAGEVIKTLMGLGIMATINQAIDQDTAVLVVEEMGHRPKAVREDAIEEQLEKSLEIEGEGEPRAPVVTVMGHVDHGKTSLLDHIRNTRVTSGEAGGITQHIGAYSVNTDHGPVSFIDTPGHAAFTAMRARGAKVTDIVVLVVAADDGVMPQTEEAIQHARAAEVPLVVAINKMDLESADPERVTSELAAKDVVPEDWGGDTQFIKVSAITGDGIDELLEAILLQADLLELKAVGNAPGRGVVVESRLDRGRGPVATMLVQNGTLKQGDVIIAGEYHGRVRAMIGDKGDAIENAGPSAPVELLGLNGTPAAGDDFSVVTDERSARDLAEFRRDRSTEHRQVVQQAAKIENMFANLGEGQKRVLKMVLKADVRGSLEAIMQALNEMGNEEVAVNILGSGVGGITGTDANMALTYGAAVFGFNVRADNSAKTIIEHEGIDLRYYGVIYELLDDVKQVLSGMLAPEVREEIVGTAEVRDVFRSPRYGDIAGCMVVEGTVFRNKPIRVLRDDVVIYEGELESLRRFKDDVNNVRAGTECGIGVRNYNDVRAGDKIEVFDTKEVAREL
ncbi:MAG: translation initiation factor IF-2 [Pseudomonadales bacterium]|jgi:translation initiation factor IF-2|nr:translation initiation factor IF-2 [Pseudomonadales bacterium]MDP6469640.1 translation initiation factor IF-2 [Pseudomonadales bacterium]MDP6827481.1 translation initiation factor IF-2 [Pseudomonadales bacterium]|tara:strand:- start:6170 stop:8740 length:2571 start_codon:yes stop_codon:yes gene_type:complete